MKRVLIIDGHPFICSLLSRTLQGNDTVVASYETIEKALPNMKDYCCDLCFLELKFSDEDTVKDLEMLRGIAPGMKVIAMSGSHVSDRMLRELERNSYFLMRKPFLPSEIRSMTCMALGSEETGFEEYGEDGAQQKRERRLSERKTVKCRIDYSLCVSNGDDIREEGDVINMSGTGMLLLTGYPVSEGNRLRFSFGDEESLGNVVWSRKNENKQYSAGIVFI